MDKKIFQRIIVLCMISVFMFNSSLPVSANYSPGPTTCELDRSQLLEKSNAELSGDTIIINANGSIGFDLFLPFESDSLTLSCNVSETTVLKIKTDENIYECTLTAEETAYTLPITETNGSHQVILSANKQISIITVCFNKINENYNTINTLVCNLSDYEEALQTAVVLKNNESAVKVHGAFQYLDVNRQNLIPEVRDGSLYVPAKALAQSLGIYCEDYPDKAYLLLRSYDTECAVIGGSGYVEHLYNKTPLSLNVFYSDSVTWVPVRSISEIMGFSVEYRDGYVVIDDGLCAKKIVSDEIIFNTLTSEFAKYIKTEAVGHTYYVAQTGSDANSGTEAYPFKTIGKACEAATAGDTVIIRGGIYRELVKPQNNGTASAPIVFRAAEGEKVLISALEPVSGFVKYDGNIWCSPMAVDLGMGRNQIFYNGEALTEGRHPNTNTKPGSYTFPKEVPDRLWPVKGNISIKKEGLKVATSDTDLNQTEKNYWKGATFVTLKGEAWTLSVADVVESDYGSITLNDPRPEAYGITYYAKVYEGDYGYLTNHLRTVDQPGEWYAGDDVLYLCPPENADPNTLGIEIKQRQLAIDLRDRQYVQFENVDTIGGGITLAGDTKGCILNGGSHRYISHYTKTMDQHASFIDSTFRDGDDRKNPNGAPSRGEVGIYIAGENNAIVNSVVDYSAAAGLYLVGKYTYVDNNIVSNTSYMGTYTSGITVEGERWVKPDDIPRGGHTITNNTVYNAGRACLYVSRGYTEDKQVYPLMACEIGYNRLFNGSLTARDTGVIYQHSIQAGNDRSKTKIHNNIVYNIGHYDETSYAYNAIIYCDGFASGEEIFDNITYYQYKELPIKLGTWMQTLTNALAVNRVKSNSDLKYFPGNPQELDSCDFPSGKPYAVGSSMDGQPRYMKNYQTITSGGNTYSIPEKTDHVYQFENVTLPENSNGRLTLYYLRKAGDTGGVLANVTVSNGSETYKTQMPLTLKDKFYINEIGESSAYIPDRACGNCTVRIEFDSETITPISLQSDKLRDSILVKFDNVIMGGSFSDYIAGNVSAPTSSFSSNANRIASKTYWSAGNTWNNTLIYRDVPIKGVNNAIMVRFGTHGQWSGSVMQIRVNSPDAEPIFTGVLEGSEWNLTEKEFLLNKELAEDIYTFYVSFGEDSEKTNDFHNLEFFRSEISNK